LDKQNVTLDVERFRPTLVKALQLLHQWLRFSHDTKCNYSIIFLQVLQ
jgi:hypothetical protein